MKIIKEIGRNPQIDWIAILFISIVIAAGLAFTGYSLYNAVTSGSIKGDGAMFDPSFKKFNEKSISSVLTTFEEKQKVSEKARAGYTGVSDPSL